MLCADAHLCLAVLRLACLSPRRAISLNCCVSGLSPNNVWVATTSGNEGNRRQNVACGFWLMRLISRALWCPATTTSCMQPSVTVIARRGRWDNSDLQGPARRACALPSDDRKGCLDMLRLPARCALTEPRSFSPHSQVTAAGHDSAVNNSSRGGCYSRQCNTRTPVVARSHANGAALPAIALALRPYYTTVHTASDHNHTATL